MSESLKHLDRIYIVNEDLKLNFEQINSEEINIEKAKEIFSNKKYYNQVLKYLLLIDYLNVENYNKIEKFLKDEKKNNHKDQVSVKKINKEQLTTIFKILGFNIVYCSQISECIIQDLNSLLQIKYEKIKIDCVKSSMVIKQKAFYDIAKNAVIKTTGFKSHIKKYFHLAYLLVSNTWFINRQGDPSYHSLGRNFGHRKVYFGFTFGE